jgi:hemerythrin superfamily protein
LFESIFQQIAGGLSQHAEMEEKVLYPQLSEALGADKVEQKRSTPG